MFKDKNLFKLSLIFIVILSLGAYLFISSNPVKVIKIGIQATPAAAPLLVAEALKLFDKYGLQVKIEDFSAGKFALQALIAGGVDLSLSGEFPLIIASKSGKKIEVVTQVTDSKANEIRVVVNNTAFNITDIGKKQLKIATSFGGGPHFYTYLLFKQLGLELSDTDIISQRPEDMPVSLKTGAVDGVIVFEPYATIAEKISNGRSIEVPQIKYTQKYVLSKLKNDHLASSEVLQIKTAISQAVLFIEQNKEQAQEIVAARTHVDLNVIRQIWDKFNFATEYSTDLQEFWRLQRNWILAQDPSSKVTIPEILSR